MLATVLYTGLRISEMLGLVWGDVDFAAGVIHVRAQLSRAHRGAPAQRVAPKTPASVRDVPLVPQLARLLSAHRQWSRFARGADCVFATARGTPYGHRNVSRRCLGRAAQLAGLNDDGWPPLRFHEYADVFVMPTSGRKSSQFGLIAAWGVGITPGVLAIVVLLVVREGGDGGRASEQ